MRYMKTDLVKEDKAYYSAKKEPDLRSFGPLSYLTITGQGEPAGTAFTRAVEALFPLAYGIRKIYKLQDMIFSVPKLEGFWWVDSDKPALDVPRKEWFWKLLIRMPEYVTVESVEQAKEQVIIKKGIQLVNDIHFETIEEGQCVQIMHIGPYSSEPETIAKMYAFMKNNNLIENGLHHEIYISDPRKTAPEKMKTILRQGVRTSD
ncbi:MAG: GyrI-like domain-containing protein [Bacteroidia bacterium]|nr:GyrI-like domain-containing protein [Bacteroidia bacterium]